MQSRKTKWFKVLLKVAFIYLGYMLEMNTHPSVHILMKMHSCLTILQKEVSYYDSNLG